ncbi:hypothetical protein RZS08_43975, partial [Arthrospira platensis SPKY1]|nr:hypothetical protein [Arthrospira platensis SPKY1]
NSYFIYFEYAQTTLGYAILTYPEKHGRTLHYTAALRDFFVPDDSDNSFTLGAVMLAYIAAHCRTMALASLRLDFRSCEANILLQALLQSLLPEQPLNSTSIVLNDQQLALLA